ncbi:MAG TPA: thioredoxin family protein [Thermoanaerobaculia bacterium]
MTHKSFALALALLAVPSLSHAQGNGALVGFQNHGDYVLSVDGKPVPSAEIYKNERVPAILVLTSALPTPVLLTPRAGTVEKVNVMKVAKQPDGTVNLLPSPTVGLLGSFKTQGENVNFTYDNRKAVLSAKAPLIGLHPAADLKSYSPEYVRLAKTYKPNTLALADLKKEAQPVTVRVVFGSWCPHCRSHLPYLLRVEDELKGSKVKFEYFGLPRPPQAWEHPEVKRLGVNGVPTGIVYVGGKEIGRIMGDAWETPEVILNRIVQTNKTKKAAAGK